MLTADLLSGRGDVRPAAGQLLRALAALPAQVRDEADQDRPVRVRADAGQHAWQPAMGMHGAFVAVLD